VQPVAVMVTRSEQALRWGKPGTTPRAPPPLQAYSRAGSPGEGGGGERRGLRFSLVAPGAGEAGAGGGAASLPLTLASVAAAALTGNGAGPAAAAGPATEAPLLSAPPKPRTTITLPIITTGHWDSLVGRAGQGRAGRRFQPVLLLGNPA
jgi:hypothetical protein